MWVSKVNEFIGSSPESFEDAASAVVVRASSTLRGIRGIEVIDRTVKIEADEVLEYRVRLRLIFDMAPETSLHW